MLNSCVPAKTGGRLIMLNKRNWFIGHVVLVLTLCGGVQAQSVQVAPNGSANYSIPIKVLPGVNKLQPGLSIQYNSNAPNGMLGVGFQLQGLPAITRINNGAGINYNTYDTFAGPGGKLVLVDSRNRIYRSENEDWIEYVPLYKQYNQMVGQRRLRQWPLFLEGLYHRRQDTGIWQRQRQGSESRHGRRKSLGCF